jgi:ribosome-associated protein
VLRFRVDARRGGIGPNGSWFRFRVAPQNGDRPLSRSTSKRTTAKIKSKHAQTDETLLSRILESLDDDKAEDVVTIDLEGRSPLADAIVIANGRSARHVSSIAEHLARRLKEAGYGTRPVDGLTQGDWALVDAGDVIVHVFRPEVRDYYDLEGMWSVEEPERASAR